MSVLSDFITRVQQKVPNVETTDLGTTEITANIQDAVRKYSKVRPLEKVDDVAGNGGYVYDLPSDWDEDFSIFQKIEYPAGNQEPTIIQPEAYMVYKDASTKKLHFLEISPSSGYTIRRTYTKLHTVSVSTSTIRDSDFDAVCSLGAALSCFDLSRRYAQDTESLIGADAVDRRGKSGKYADRARELLKEFKDHVLGAEESIAPAIALKEFDSTYGWNEDFITHPASWR